MALAREIAVLLALYGLAVMNATCAPREIKSEANSVYLGQCSIESVDIASPWDNCNTCICFNGMVASSCTKVDCSDVQGKKEGELCGNRANNCRADLQCVEKWQGHNVGICENLGSLAKMEANFDGPDEVQDGPVKNICPEIKILSSSGEEGHFNLTPRKGFFSQSCYFQGFTETTTGANTCVVASGYLDKSANLWKQEIIVDIFGGVDAGRYSVYFENPHCKNQNSSLCYKLETKKLEKFEEHKAGPCVRELEPSNLEDADGIMHVQENDK